MSTSHITVDVLAAWIDAQVCDRVDAEVLQRAEASLIAHLPLRTVLGGWKNGDETTWTEEFVQLALDEPQYINDLTADIVANGIKEPILLGADGRIWDGHHRLLVAMQLGLDEVPCRFAEQIGLTARPDES